MPINLLLELARTREPDVSNAARLLKLGSKLEHFGELRAWVGNRRSIDMLEKHKDLGGPRLLKSFEGLIELLFRVRAIGGVWRRLPPPTMHCQDEDIAGGNLLVDDGLYAAARARKGVSQARGMNSTPAP